MLETTKLLFDAVSKPTLELTSKCLVDFNPVAEIYHLKSL